MNCVDATLLVIAKQPLPGRVKTRLCPPCTPVEAADLAAAALLDTLDAIDGTPAARRILVFEGDPTSWTPPGFETFAQRGEGLGERLENAFADTYAGLNATATATATTGPVLLVGMDTPQLTPGQLIDTLDALVRPGVDAVIAPTFDGGYWCIGFNQPVPGAFDNVPMSTEATYEAQLGRLGELGLEVAVTEPLCDVDTIADAHRVANGAPSTRFADALGQVASGDLERAAFASGERERAAFASGELERAA